MSYFAAFRQYFLGGDYRICYVISGGPDWQIVRQNFEEIVVYNQTHIPQLMVSVSENQIDVAMDRPWVLRAPADRVYLNGVILPEAGKIAIHIHVSVGDHYRYLMSIIKGLLFFVTLLVVAFLFLGLCHGNLEGADLFVFVPLLGFQFFFGLSYLLLRAEAGDLFRKLEWIITEGNKPRWR